MLSAFLENITSIASVLPGQIAAFVSVVQARAALQANSPARLLEVTEKGLAGLDSQKAHAAESGMSQYADCLRASLLAFEAIARRRLREDESLSQESYRRAVAAFTNLLNSGSQAADPFLGDYLGMLAEFGAADEALQVAARLAGAAESAPGKGESAVSIVGRFGQTPPARAILDFAAKLEPADQEAAFRFYQQAASLAIAANNPDLALKATEKALSIHSDNPCAHRVRGLLRWQSKNFEGAAEDFAAAVAHDPYDMESRVALARAALELNRADEALVQLSLVRSKQPDNIDANWLYGVAQIRLGEAENAGGNREKAEDYWRNAILSLTSALEQRPKHAACLRSRAIAYFDLNKFDEALADLDLALSSDPDDVDGHGWRAAVLSKMGKHDEALAAVNVALALADGKPGSAVKRCWLLTIRGRELLAMNWTEQAIADLKEAHFLDPGNMPLMHDLLKAYDDKGDWPGLAACAREMQNAASITSEERVELRKVEITALRNAREYESTFAALDREPRPSLDDADMVWLRGRILADVGDFEAADLLLSAPSGNRKTVDQLSLAGWIVQNLEPRDSGERTALGDRGRELYEAALSISDPAVKNKTDDIWLRKGLANALLRSGQKSRAFEEFDGIIAECETALRKYKPNPRLISLAGWCYHCRENYSSAFRCYEDALSAADPPLPAEFDYALVLTSGREPGSKERAASEGAGDSSASASPGIDRYRKAIGRAENENVLRRIGVLRVALHDLREVAFRDPGLMEGARAAGLLIAALKNSLKDAPDPEPEYKDHLNAFIAIIEASLSGAALIPAGTAAA